MYISEFQFCFNIVYLHHITILYDLFYYSSWGKILDEFTNTVNPITQFCHSRHLLVHLQKPQKTPAIVLITTSVPSAVDIHQTSYVLYSQNTIQNDATITNNDKIQSCETPKIFIVFQLF